MNGLSGSVAVVTGASRGLGAAIAARLAAAGARVGLVARSAGGLEAVAASITAAGGTAAVAVAELTERDEVEAAFAALAAGLGSVDVLVNNAGSASAWGAFVEVDPDAWWRDVELNLRPAALCTHAVIEGMLARGRGRIVNMASGMANVAGASNTSYASAKAALVKLTEGIAASTAASGVAVFAISPGLVRTEMSMSAGIRRFAPELAAAPAEAWLSADVVAGLVLRLARGDADALSGRFLHARDDLDALVARAGEIVERDDLVLRLRGYANW